MPRVCACVVTVGKTVWFRHVRRHAFWWRGIICQKCFHQNCAGWIFHEWQKGGKALLLEMENRLDCLFGLDTGFYKSVFAVFWKRWNEPGLLKGMTDKSGFLQGEWIALCSVKHGMIWNWSVICIRCSEVFDAGFPGENFPVDDRFQFDRWLSVRYRTFFSFRRYLYCLLLPPKAVFFQCCFLRWLLFMFFFLQWQ